MQTVEARVFGSETLICKNNVEAKDHDGDWTKCLRSYKMLNVAPFENWAIITPRSAYKTDQKNCYLIESFIAELRKVSKGLGMPFPNPTV